MPPLLRSLRPRQWSKNLVVFAGLIFSGGVFEAGAGRSTALVAFLAFCAASSSVYLLNDVLDRERDRLHPHKRLRPIAAGQIAPRTALALAAVLGAAALGVAWLLARPAAAPLAGFLALQLLYSLRLKHLVLIDVFCIAAGFLLRVLAGVWAVEVPVSPWLVTCTVQLALFLALCKRRAELVGLEDAAATGQRPLLADYSGPGLDVMIALVASATVVTYSLYTLLPGALLTLDVPVESKAGRPGMVWTLPLALYGILRYLHLVYRGERGERPEKVLMEDRPLLLAILAYAVVVGLVLYA